MPTYEYACKTCGKEFEVFQSIKADPLTTCDCGQGGQVHRKIGRGAGIIFKGTGFYETDYKRKGDSGSASSSSSSSNTNSSPSSAPSTPSTPAAPPATPPSPPAST
ncbi:MAG TPA: FmdB family zinc ribbon protein [Opitutaceae bacterium]